MRRLMNNSRGRNGRGPTLRRGSALVIVIGTLALISVFAAIYIAIGRADTRAADTVKVRAAQDDYAEVYAAHVAEVIGRDRLDATLQYADANLTYQVPRRESTDMPYTDWSVRSESANPSEWFFPWGGNPYPRPAADRFDPRVPSDPWLASLRPTYIGPPPGIAGAFPLAAESTPDPELAQYRRYLDDRDWYQISNFARDGRPVNLFNLRPQSAFGGAAIGGFDSEPGWGVTNNPGGPQVRRMSEGLSLFNLDNINNRLVVRSFDPTADGIWLPGEAFPILPPGFSADDIRNTPAVWTMFQRYAVIPLNQTFVTYNRNGDVSDWSDPDYPPYQWGDADGDGLADSRWFELTEARDPVGTDSGPRGDIQTLYPGGDMRVFAAVRAVDLSAMVNVNTAIDSLTPPTEDHPMGLTPAEVDLRRLLTRQDISANNLSLRAVVGNRQPYPLSFADLRRERRDAGVPNIPSLWPDSDYSRYAADFENRGVPLDFMPVTPLDPGVPGQNNFPNAPSATQPEFPNSLVIGRYAAAAVRRSIELNAPLPRAYRGALSVPPAASNDPYHLPEGSPLQRDGDTADAFNDLAERKADVYRRVGSLNPLRLGEAGTLALDGIAPTAPEARYFGAGLFGLDDLAELLTFHGVNDPEVTSRLEIAMGGRFRFDGGTGDERYSPLLSTRPLTLDRDAHGEVLVNRFNPNRGTEVSGQMSPETMALLAMSPRTRLTTLSGAVKLRPGIVAGGTFRGNNESVARKLTIDDAAVPISALGASGAEAFSVYYGALAGELESFRPKRGSGVDGLPAGILNNVWATDLSLARDSAYATLFYGHRGPELALRVAAHAAVNAKDMFDADTVPTIATMVLDNAPVVRNLIDTVRTQLDAISNIGDFNLSNSAEALLYPGLLDSLLDPDAGPEAANNNNERVLPTNRLPDGRRMVNVYGVEPTPIITEVAAFSIYTDASVNAGGDDDSGPEPRSIRPGIRPILQGDSLEQITINSARTHTNPDMMTQVIAIQLTNPWDEDIVLGGGTGPGGIMWRRGENARDYFDPDNNLEFNYYIEYNGRFFKLGEFREYLPPLTNGGIDYRANNDYALGGGPNVNPNGQQIPLASIDDSYLELEYRNVVLGPGESRVFYITAHTRMDDQPAWGGLEERWKQLIWEGGPVDDEYQLLTITNPDDNDADGDGLPDGYDSKGWTGPAQEWLERRQFRSRRGGMSFPVRIHPFDPRTGELVEGEGTLARPASFVDFIGTSGDPAADFGLTGRTAKPGLVRLWRKHTVNGIEEVPDRLRRRAGQIRENLVQNDILVDRMYLGATDSDNYLANALWSDADNEIENSVSFPEAFAPVNNPCNAGSDILNIRNDNTGITFARWASVRRKDTARTLSGNDEIEADKNVGKIDSYLLASRRDPQSLIERIDNSTIIPDDPEILDLLELCDPTDPLNGYNGVVGMLNTVEYDAERTLRSFWLKGMNQLPVVQTVATHPRRKNDNDPGPTSATDDPLGRFDPAPLADNATGRNLFDNQADELRPEVFLRKDLDAARVTDALLAMGIGPAYSPNLTANPRDPRANYEVYDDEWMTLSEAFAIALGFENFTAANPLTDANPDIVWFDAARTITGQDPEYVLDDLRLRFDDYVPFLNLGFAPDEIGPNGKVRFTTRLSDPVVPDDDARRGTGVPLALGVLDAVAPIDPPKYPGEQDNEQWRLTSPVMGLININTAPLDVLRTLPGLTPSAQMYRTISDPTLKTEWWGANVFSGTYTGLVTDADLGVPNLDWLNATSAVNNPDVAATLTAYRDRTVARPRVRSDTSVDSPGARLALSYAPAFNNPDVQRAFLDNLYTEIPVLPGQDVSLPRTQVSGVDALRGAPGFGSLGEVLMASIDTDALRSDFPNIADMPHLSADFYARDGKNLGVAGSGENAVSLSPQFNNGRSGNVVDDYAERLAMAAGIMNLTTTRSDFFAVWMLLQGYRESDVATLRENDPLVPSFQKRYLMVIDRSNVVEPGDQPRIVLFREVPL